VKFQAFILDESHNLLLKLSCKSACENRVAVSAVICCTLFSANIAVEQGVIVAAIMIAIFVFTRFLYTPTQIHSKPSRDFALIKEGIRKICCSLRMNGVDRG